MGRPGGAKPSWVKVAAALAVAPTIPVLLVGAFFAAATSSGGVKTITAILTYVMLYAVWLAYLPTLFLGLPLYLLLRTRARLTPASGAAGGVAVALLGVGISIFGPAAVQGAPIGPVSALVPVLFATAGLGAVAGLGFWVVLEPPHSGVR